MGLSLNVPIQGRVKACLDLVKSVGPKNKTIIDVGSSVGWIEQALENADAKEIIGIEPQRQVLEFAQKNVKGAKFILGDALDIPVESNYADLVLFFDVLEHVPKTTEKKALIEISRVLKKNGLLLLSTPHDNFFVKVLDPAWYFGHRHYSIDRVKELLTKSGFEIVELKLKGNIWSSVYVVWFYIMKYLTGDSQPHSKFFDGLEERGYAEGKTGTIFLIAKAKK